MSIYTSIYVSGFYCIGRAPRRASRQRICWAVPTVLFKLLPCHEKRLRNTFVWASNVVGLPQWRLSPSTAFIPNRTPTFSTADREQKGTLMAWSGRGESRLTPCFVAYVEQTVSPHTCAQSELLYLVVSSEEKAFECHTHKLFPRNLCQLMMHLCVSLPPPPPQGLS